MGSFIDLKSDDGMAIANYVAQPAGSPKGAIVVLQEIFGVNAHIRAVADGFAAQGYLAVAPANFQRLKPGIELGYTPQDVALGASYKAVIEELPAPGVLRDIAASVAYAAQAGKVGVVGYCWGGLLTWRSACLLDGISAAVPYYGGGTTTPVEIARQPRCPVLAHYAEMDQHIPMDGVKAFAAAHPEVQVQVYAANHGFNCDHRASWDAPSAKLALERTLAFFGQHLA